MTNSAYVLKMCVGVSALTCACTCGCQNVFMDAMMPWVSSFTSCPLYFFEIEYLIEFGSCHLALIGWLERPWNPPVSTPDPHHDG